MSLRIGEYIVDADDESRHLRDHFVRHPDEAKRRFTEAHDRSGRESHAFEFDGRYYRVQYEGHGRYKIVSRGN